MDEAVSPFHLISKFTGLSNFGNCENVFFKKSMKQMKLKIQTWRSTVSRTEVRNIVFSFDKLFCAAKISQFQNSRFRIEKNIFRLDIAVADVLRVDVGKTPEELVHDQLGEDGRDHLLHGLHLAHVPAHGCGHELHHEA